MDTEASVASSRRQFLTAGVCGRRSLSCSKCFSPRQGARWNAFKEAATAKVTVQNLRRNISVLLGAGGNIAVLTGPDGKLLVDAEIITARPNVSKALASINADPVQTTDQHSLAFRPHRW